MKLHEIAEKLELEKLTPAFEKDVTGVYISDMVSDVIANAKAGNLLVTVQVHANALAAANLVDIAGIVVAQGKRPTDDVVKMAEKAEISIFTTALSRWQVATSSTRRGSADAGVDACGPWGDRVADAHRRRSARLRGRVRPGSARHFRRRVLRGGPHERRAGVLLFRRAPHHRPDFGAVGPHGPCRGLRRDSLRLRQAAVPRGPAARARREHPAPHHGAEHVRRLRNPVEERPHRERTPMTEVLYKESFRIVGNDFEHGGEAAARVKAILKQLGFPTDAIRRLSIANFEAEMNVIMYADEATMELAVLPDAVRVTIADRGRGIPDIAWAMQEGNSTATPEMRARGFGAGLGLPNIKRNSDEFDISSTVNVGTTLSYVVHSNAIPTASDDRSRPRRRHRPGQVHRVRRLLAGVSDEGDPGAQRSRGDRRRALHRLRYLHRGVLLRCHSPQDLVAGRPPEVQVHRGCPVADPLRPVRRRRPPGTGAARAAPTGVR